MVDVCWRSKIRYRRPWNTPFWILCDSRPNWHRCITFNISIAREFPVCGAWLAWNFSLIWSGGILNTAFGFGDFNLHLRRETEFRIDTRNCRVYEEAFAFLYTSFWKDFGLFQDDIRFSVQISTFIDKNLWIFAVVRKAVLDRLWMRKVLESEGVTPF